MLTDDTAAARKREEDQRSDAEAFSLLTRTEESTTDPDRVREQKRNTIKLLHTAYSMLKALMGPLKLFAVLISNYQENKRYVRSKQDDNLAVLIQQALGKLGLDKSITPADGQRLEDCLYTVRSVAMLTFVDEEMHITFSGAMSREPLTDSQKRRVNEWLRRNDKAAPQITTDGPVRLFIDYDSIANERACVRKRLEELRSVADPDYVSLLLSSDCARINGTFDGLDKVEFAGDRIVYSDSDLPRMPSQIMCAQQKGYEP